MREAAAALLITFWAIASFYDLRERRIPNAINYTCLAAALVLAPLTQSAWYIAIVALYGAFAYALYSFKAWAGGDVKFFTALAALYPIAKGIKAESEPLYGIQIFLIAALAFVPLLLILKRGALKSSSTKIVACARAAVESAALRTPLAAALLVLASAALKLTSALVVLIAVLAIGALKPPLILTLPFFALVALWSPSEAFVALAIALPLLFLQSLSLKVWPYLRAAMRRRVRLNDVKPGDISAFTIYLSKKGPRRWRKFGKPPGRIVASSAARGLSEGEIKELKRLGVKSLVIRESAPFAPLLGIGAVASFVI